MVFPGKWLNTRPFPRRCETLTLAIIEVNLEGLCYPLGLVLRGEKSSSSALNVGSVPPSPYRSFQSLQGALYPDYASETFLRSTTQCPRQ